MSERAVALQMERWTVRALTAIAMTAIIVLLVSLLLSVSGFGAGKAFRALLSGSLGSSYAITSATLVRAIPLIITGLSVALAFRAGVLNVGAEGQLLVGAAAATAATLGSGVGNRGIVPIALAAAATAGAAWAYLPAVLKLRRGVLEVISTIMMNFAALHAVGYLVRGPLQEPTRIYPQSAIVAEGLRLPLLIDRTRLHVGAIIALLLAIACWYFLQHTAAGFRFVAVGANVDAARSAGLVDVGRVRMRAFLLSGALAGLAGGVEVLGVTYALYENLSPGYGYTAIAVALLAALHPLGVIVSGVAFGALQAGAVAMQRDAGVPSVIAAVVEALIVLGLLSAAVLTPRILRWRQTRASASRPTAARDPA
jgi:general nucleoside transport system permease protein